MDAASMHQSILVYRSFRYLKWAALLVLASLVAYIVHKPYAGVANGGSWLGYTLGTVSALIILWLMFLGIRKRRYGIGKVKLEDWVSAHVYLGLSLVIIATLHSGFQFGWNVHTLAYGLMMVVIASGIFGVYAYVRYPQIVTDNRHGLTLDKMLGQIADLDKEMRSVAVDLGEEVNRTILRAAQETRVGGSLGRMLSGREANCATTAARKQVETMSNKGGSEVANRRLLALLVRKEELLRRARRDVQLTALMQVWLFAHVPLSFALLAALLSHVVSVFFYW
jgi:hypothetical protein